jgi:pyrimidine operon attenuation protein/uracil phosphoribosyltransferase
VVDLYLPPDRTARFILAEKKKMNRGSDTNHDTDESDHSVILTDQKQHQVITRMAHEIVEKNPNLENAVIIGVITRGGVLAERLSVELKRITGLQIPVGTLDPTLYRDDFKQKGALLAAKITEVPFSIDDKTVLLVDDVLFTGRTINAAITHLFDMGRPKEIQLAVLIDRGHRELPIRPDYCGKNVPTQYVEKIRVRFLECDGKDIVLSGLDENAENSGENG